jgi:hypothetical protein
MPYKYKYNRLHGQSTPKTTALFIGSTIVTLSLAALYNMTRAYWMHQNYENDPITHDYVRGPTKARDLLHRGKGEGKGYSSTSGFILTDDHGHDAHH